MGGFRDRAWENGDAHEDSSTEEEDPSRKPPFPAELKLARTRLAKARRSGDEVLEGVALLAVGELKLRSAKYGRAMQRAQAAMDIFPQAAGKAESLRLMVRVHLAQHDILEAHKLLEDRSRAFQRTPRDPKAVAILRLVRADVFLALDRPEQSLREANEALEDFKRLGDEAWEATSSQTLARVSLHLGKTRHLRRALQLAEKALKFFKHLNDADEEAAMMMLISQLHAAKQEYEDAHLFAKAAADLSRARGALSNEAAAQQQIATVMLAQQGDPEAAGSLAKQATTKFRKNGDVLGEISAHQVVASAHQAEGLVNMALEALNEALTLARKLGSRHLISTLMELIVKIYDPEGALDVMREEEELARRSGDVRRELFAMRRVAFQQVTLEQFDQAVQTAEEALDLARGAGDKRTEAMAMQLLGEVSRSCGQAEEALDAFLHARTLFQEACDVPGEATALELVVDIYKSQNQDTKAQQSLDEQQRIYHQAGWTEKEAQALLSMAKVLIKNRGTIRAVEKAREAIALFRENDAESQAMKADAMLELAEIMKGNIRYAREAPEQMRQAQEVFREIQDAAGQARALKRLADLYREKDPQRSVEVLREARKICRAAEDKREEAQAALEIANLHMDEIQKCYDRRVEPDAQSQQDAIDAFLETVPLLQALGDVPQHLTSLLLLSGLYVDKDEGEYAQQYAEEALQLAVKEHETHFEAHALLGVAKAHLSLHEGEQAKQCALGARELFEKLENEDGIDQATIVVENAKVCPKEPKKRTKKIAPAPTLATAAQQDEAIPHSNSTRSAGKGRFSSMMESFDSEIKAEKDAIKDAMEKQQRREELLTRSSPQKNVPDQEQRKREIANSFRATAGGQEQAQQGEEELPELKLSDVLKHVKPDWKEKDVCSVQDKLGMIGIGSPMDLYEMLQSVGVGGINTRLKQANQKQLKAETLNALFVSLDEFYQRTSFG